MSEEIAVRTLDVALEEAVHSVNDQLESLLPRGEGMEKRVCEAMRYALFVGGKRLRPFLVLTSAALFDVPKAQALRVAAAVEMIHTYSLVHDDLPAMDDDDLRRGQPTCHVKFDEATAILAGDALLTEAFRVLAAPETHPDGAVRAALVGALAEASGAGGMVGGQMTDLAAQHKTLDIGEITRLQQMKTGALIVVSCEMGALLGDAPSQARAALRAYAHDLGLAFQIADDLLDAEGEEADMGKKVGKDAEAGKATFVSLLGLDRARTEAAMLADQAAGHLDIFGQKAQLLQDVARYVIKRRS